MSFVLKHLIVVICVKLNTGVSEIVLKHLFVV